MRSRRRSSTSTCTIGASRTPPSSRPGRSSATESSTSPRAAACCTWRLSKSSTISTSSSTATCSASTDPSAATARSCRSSSRTSAAPAGTSSRPSGVANGTRRWPRVVTVNTPPEDGDPPYEGASGGFGRDNFFGRDPRTKAMVEDYSDDQIWNLKRGGHDYRKVLAAYKAAVEHTGQPTAILVKTVKGYPLGPHLEARNATHQMQKMTDDDLRP